MRLVGVVVLPVGFGANRDLAGPLARPAASWTLSLFTTLLLHAVLPGPNRRRFTQAVVLNHQYQSLSARLPGWGCGTPRWFWCESRSRRALGTTGHGVDSGTTPFTTILLRPRAPGAEPPTV